MRESIYEWMKNLAVYYILLNTVLNFMPDGKYVRYLRYFMGIILISMLCTPLFNLFGRGEELKESFQSHVLEQNVDQAWWALENVQETYLQLGYEQQAQEEIQRLLEAALGEAVWAKVQLEPGGEPKITSVVITAAGSPSEEKERMIRDELERVYGVGEEKLTVLFQEYDRETVAGDPSGGCAAGGDRSSGGE